MGFAGILDQATGICCGNNYCHVDMSSIACFKKIEKGVGERS